MCTFFQSRHIKIPLPTKPIVALKVLNVALDGRLMSPYRDCVWTPKDIFHSDRESAELTSEEMSTWAVHHGVHTFYGDVSLIDRRLCMNFLSCMTLFSFYPNDQLFAVEVQPEDIVVIAEYELVCTKCKLIGRVTNNKFRGVESAKIDLF